MMCIYIYDELLLVNARPRAAVPTEHVFRMGMGIRNLKMVFVAYPDYAFKSS